MDQVREVLRVKHYAIRTERAYCDWIRRYVRLHGMRSREDLFPGTEKVVKGSTHSFGHARGRNPQPGPWATGHMTAGAARNDPSMSAPFFA